MKESKTLIIGLVVFVFLVLVVAGSYFSGREVLFAEEPNEPKTTYTAEELDEIYKDEPALGKLAKELYGFTEPIVLDIGTFIPTWPDYIELEKDLEIQCPKEPNSPYKGMLITIGKGTKIYFKE